MTRRPVRIAALAVVLLLAAALRFSGLSWGLRHPPHSDEQDFVTRVVAMVKAGDLDHRWYQYPGLFLYLLGAGVATLARERWDTPDVYLASRSVVAAFGVLNVGLLYLAGLRRVGVLGGLAAALLLAVSPLDIATSHQVRADIVLQTAGILALIVWPGVGRETRGDVRAGLVLGFASAVKFTGLLLVPSYLLARLLAPGRRLLGVAIAGAVTIAVVLACTPYAILHWRQYFGFDPTAGMVYNSVRGGPATYYKGDAAFGRTLLFMLGGAATTLGPIAAGLFVAGAFVRLRESWRAWLPHLLHPVVTLLVVAPAGMMFQRHVLPAMGVVYLLAATPIEMLFARSRPAAVALALAAAVLPLRASYDAVWTLSRPSASDHVLDWIDANLPPGSRILETRPGSQVGGMPGMALGIDRRRFELLEMRSDGDRAALGLLAPEMDLIVVGPGSGGAWRSGFRTAFAGVGPRGAVGVQLQAPLPEARRGYQPIDVPAWLRSGRLRLKASHNDAELSAIADGDLRTSWSSAAPMAGREWIEVELPDPVPLGRIELVLGNVPEGYGPELQLQLGAGELEPVRHVEARARPSQQNPDRRPVSQVLVFAPRTARIVRLLQAGVRREPWSVAEIRLDAVSAP